MLLAMPVPDKAPSVVPADLFALLLLDLQALINSLQTNLAVRATCKAGRASFGVNTAALCLSRPKAHQHHPTCEGLKQLLECFPNLRDLRAEPYLMPFFPTMCLPSLTALDLGQAWTPDGAHSSTSKLEADPRLDLSPLAACIKFKSLDLSRSNIFNLTPLTPCAGSLTRLVLTGCKSIHHANPLVLFTELREVDLLGTCVHMSVKTLSPCRFLTTLAFTFHRAEVGPWAKTLDYILPLQQCSSLTRLTIGGCRALEGIKALSGFTALTDLALLHIRSLQDISMLASLPWLVSLRMTHSRNLSALWPLAALSCLTTLEVTGCEAAEIKPLGHLTRLRFLSLASSYLMTDIKPLATCSLLQGLDLAGAGQYTSTRTFPSSNAWPPSTPSTSKGVAGTCATGRCAL